MDGIFESVIKACRETVMTNDLILDIPPTAPHPMAKERVNISFFHRGQLYGSFGESEG